MSKDKSIVKKNKSGEMLGKALGYTYLFLVMLMIFLYGCDSENSNAAPKAQSGLDQQVEKTKTEPEKFIYQIEDVNQSSHYDQARIQFLWSPTDEWLEGIWSIKIDGSDLAMVIGPEWLYEDGWSVINVPPVRSHDNRYVAVIQYKENSINSYLRIFDLKEKTSYEPLGRGGLTSVEWSKDDETLYMRYSGWIESYHIPSKTLKKIVEIRGYKFFKLTKNGTQFSALNSHKKIIKIYNLEGILINEIKIIINGFREFLDISEDAEFVSFIRLGYINQGQFETGLVNVLKPNKEIYNIKESLYNSKLSPDNKYLFVSGPRRYEVKTGNVEHLFFPRGMNKEYGRNISLYNLDKWK